MEDELQRQAGVHKGMEEEADDDAGDHERSSGEEEGKNTEGMLEEFEKSKQRLLNFMNSLGEGGDQPVNMEKYRSELPSLKFQLLHNAQDIVNIVDLMIKKARNTRKHKKNWSKYDLVVMFWLIEKYNNLHSKKPQQYTQQDWVNISKMIPGKHNFACLFKWLNLKMNTKSQREPWTEVQSDILKRLVMERKKASLDQVKSHWSIISHQLYIESPQPKVYRTAKQCRERWSCTNPDIKKDLWSKAEDIELLKGYLTVGKKWAMISRELGARTQNAVKNRFELLQKKIINKAKKEAYQHPVRNYILKYIQELELDELMTANEQMRTTQIPPPRVQDNMALPSPLLSGVQKIPGSQTEIINKTEPLIQNEGISQHSQQLQHLNEQTRKVKFCRMTGDMFSQLRKNLVPAVFENEHLTLHKPNSGFRIQGWIKFDPRNHSAFRDPSFGKGF